MIKNYAFGAYLLLWCILLSLIKLGKGKFFFADYDGWVGYYIDRHQNKPNHYLSWTLYICPLPYCVFLFWKMKGKV